MATSYNGWLVDDIGSTIDQSFNINGVKYPGGVRSGDVSIVFKWFLSRLATLEAPRGPSAQYPTGECWGWEVRADKNDSSLWSCHASGTAVDHNAPSHPNGGSRYQGWSNDQIAQIYAWLNEAEVIAWGADFNGTKDPMHFEIKGSVSQVNAAAIRLSGQVVPTQGWDDMATKQEIQDAVQSVVQTAVTDAMNRVLSVVQNISQDVYNGTVSILRADEFKLDQNRRNQDVWNTMAGVLHAPEFAGWQNETRAAANVILGHDQIPKA